MVKKNEDNSNINKSFYQELKEFHDRNKGELYSFQDFEKDGIREFNVLTYKVNELKEYEKNRLSYDLMELIINIIDNKDEIKTLEGYLTLNPIINYYNCVVETFKELIEMHKHFKEDLNILFEDMITSSNNEEVIKFGLTILPILKIKNMNEILEVFSIHNKFVFYVINAYKKIDGCSNKIFELAKISRGYGKVFCIEALKPTSYEIEQYLVEESSNNDVAVPELIEYSILSMDLYGYLEKTKFNKYNLELVSRTFSAMILEYGLNEIKDEIKVCNKMLQLIDDYGDDLYSLYVVISILYSLEGNLIDSYKEKKEALTLKYYDEYEKIIKKCAEICKNPQWIKVVANEFSNLEIETTILISCIEKIDYKIKKGEFENLINRDKTNPILYKYGISSKNKTIRKCCIKFGEKYLPINEILSGQTEMKIDEVSYEEISLICFFIIIKYSNKEDFEDDEYKNLNLNALKCQLVETRTQAVENLQAFKSNFNEVEIQKIRNALNDETVSSIRRGLNSLLLEKESIKRKVVLKEKIEGLSKHAKDVYLTSAFITGNDDIDRSPVYNNLEEDEMIYFVTQENEEEKVLVSTYSGYVIGYLPKILSVIVKNLMKKEKYVYGKVEQISDDYSEISIGIYLSYKDVVDEIGNTLTLLSDRKKYLLQ